MQYVVVETFWTKRTANVNHKAQHVAKKTYGKIHKFQVTHLQFLH